MIWVFWTEPNNSKWRHLFETTGAMETVLLHNQRMTLYSLHARALPKKYLLIVFTIIIQVRENQIKKYKVQFGMMEICKEYWNGRLDEGGAGYYTA